MEPFLMKIIYSKIQLMSDLNLSGKLLVNSYFMKLVFGKLTEMLGHHMATEGSPSIKFRF